MKFILSINLLLLLPLGMFSQGLTGQDLLKKTIQYHDPNSEWSNANLKLSLKAERGDGSVDTQQIVLNLSDSYFLFDGKSAGKKVVRELKGDVCRAELEGSDEISAEAAKKYRLSCESIQMYRDYYLYLYGLPMKLKDPGTIIDEEVVTTKFNGKFYHVLKVGYEPEVGSHTWLFFIDTETFAMEGYQFYRNEETKKGEYITLEGMSTIGSMRIPKTRKWYTYPEKEYLGADILLNK